MTDIEIARNTELEKINKIAEKLNIDEDDIECYGKYKAKISNSVYEKLKDKKDGKLLNGKEKRIARYAKKMGIASLEGISEKRIFEKIMDKLGRNKGRRLLKSKDKTKALGSGSIAQENKKKTIDLINQDREQQGIRSAIKVDNKDNKIEKAAQEQIGKEVQDIMEHEQEEQK